MASRHPSSSRPTATHFLSSAYDPDLEREFFGRVMLPNGSVKTTYERRLDDVNELACPYIRELPFPVQILDVAASSGVSTAEWHEQLRSRGVPCSLTATDLSVNVYHVRTNSIEAVLDRELQVIHLGIRGRGMPPRAAFPYSLVTGSAKAYIRWKLLRGLQYEPMRLVTRRFSELPDLRMVEDDLLADPGSAMAGQFHVIRAANVLNFSYFSESLLARMIANLKIRLRDGGLLIVCRTDQNGTNNGAIFRLRDARFVALNRIGRGSEVEHLILTP